MTTAAILEPACPPGTDPTLAAPLPFDPDKRALHAILQRLVSPDYDLADIASCFRITLMDLMDWLERPDVSHLVKRLERHIRRKARLAARASAPLVIRSLRRTLNAFQRDDDAELARPPEDRTIAPDPRDRDRVIRTREAVRKAAALLERIAKAPAPRRSSAKRHADRRPLRSTSRAAAAPQLNSAPSTPSAPTSNDPVHEHAAISEEVAPQSQPAHDTADINAPAPHAHISLSDTPPPGVTPAPDPENPDTAPT